MRRGGRYRRGPPIQGPERPAGAADRSLGSAGDVTGTITAIPNHGWGPASFTLNETVGVHIYQILIDPNGTIPQSSRDSSVTTLWVTVYPTGSG